MFRLGAATNWTDDMTTDTSIYAARTAKEWFLPIALAGLGVLGWACEDGATGGGGDDSATSGADDGADDGGDGGDDTAGGGPVSRRDVLSSIGRNVIVPATEDFASQASTLRDAVEAYAAAADAGDDTAETLQAAQDAWTQAAGGLQRLEVMQVGPAAPALTTVAGEGLRDGLYSWPTADSCVVDRAIVAEDYAADDFFVTQLVWAYGMDALEYLLFVDAQAHTCPSQIQLDGPWDSLGSEQIGVRRAAYASVLAQDLATKAAGLVSRWSVDGDDFAGLLASPGQGDSPYDDETDALNDVFRAMFYVDQQSKDGKLGLPLGVLPGCDAVPCINLMESPHAQQSTAALIANLEGLRAMILGGPDADSGDGFDDLLIEMGEGDIATTLLDDIDTAVAAATDLDASLQTAATSDAEAAQAMYDSVKEVTDTLKGPFVMALMLTVPAEGAGDND